MGARVNDKTHTSKRKGEPHVRLPFAHLKRQALRAPHDQRSPIVLGCTTMKFGLAAEPAEVTLPFESLAVM